MEISTPIVVKNKSVIVCSLDKEKVVYMFKMLNLKIYDKDVGSTFLKDVTQGRASWVDLEPAKLDGMH